MILVTGASGFVGSALVQRLLADGRRVRGVFRRTGPAPAGLEMAVVPDLAGEPDWRQALAGVEVVVHAAARAHVMRETARDPLSEYRRTNVEGTLNLARQAAAAGVRRFVFLSSVKVNGEATLPGQAYSEQDRPAPQDAYGQSKLEAEQDLQRLGRDSGMEVVIIRPPLVYGPGVRANFRALVRLVASGAPLPLASVDNRRSLVGLDNLVDFVATCCDHPAAANQVFLVSDGADVSTPSLVQAIARAQGRPSRLFPFPVPLLRLGAALLRRPALFQRLCGNLQVDISRARQVLGWRPPRTLAEGLSRMMELDPP